MMIKIQENKQMDEYLDLPQELKMMWNVMVMVILIVVRM